MDHPGSLLDSLFALGILAFILITGLVSIRRFVRAAGTDPHAPRSLVLGPGIRAWYGAYLQPIEDRCVQWNITPTALSCTQLLASVIVGYLFARGLLFTGGWLLLATGSLDVIDGRVARRTGTGSKRGAFLDSVIDRYADSSAFFGLAIYFRDTWLLWPTLFALLGGLMVSYTRARAEGLGADCKVGLLQRPERYVILGFGMIFGTLVEHLTGAWTRPGQHPLIAAVVVILAVLVNFTAVQRIVHVWRALGDAPHA